MSKTERKMGPRGLLQKANSAKIGAKAFIDAHREYLTTGELAYVTGPIVAKIDAGELYPTPGMQELKVAVMSHIMLIDAMKAEEKEQEAKAGKPGKTSKPFMACVRDGSGAMLSMPDGKPMKATFDLPQRASGWIDRRLFESSPDCYGEVTHLKAHNPATATDTILRDDSIARILKTPMGPVCKGTKSSGTLGFGVKVKPSKVTFSHG